MALLSLLPDLGGWERPLLGLAVVVLLAWAHERFVAIQYPKNLPFIGSPPGKRSFSWRVYKDYYTNSAKLQTEAWENYAKKGKAVVIPGIGFRREVIMPPSAMPWVLRQKPDVLSVGQAHRELDQIDVSPLGDHKYVTNAWQGYIVRDDLNGVLENVCAALNDELGLAFARYFGTDTAGWREVGLDDIRLVVGQAASRFTVGAPLCRNHEYNAANFALIDHMVVNAGVSGAMPRGLQPLVGALVNLGQGAKLAAVGAHLKPVLARRIAEFREDPARHTDHLQMIIAYAAQHCPAELDDLDDLTKRIFTANFGSMHQTSLQTMNLLLNILGSDAEFNTIAVLRDEAKRLLEGPGGERLPWTKNRVARMVRADSVSRETLRLNSFGNRSVFRKVLVDGLTTEEGIVLPKGAVLSFLGYPAQTDPDKFGQDGLKFDPFRFSRQREAAAGANGEPGLANLSFVATSAEHLPFGHGKHSCPGRWLIDFEMKQIMACVLANYDIELPPEHNNQRPPQRWLAEAMVPPDVKIRVRRREGTV